MNSRCRRRFPRLGRNRLRIHLQMGALVYSRTGKKHPCRLASARLPLQSQNVKNANPITLLVHAGSRFHRKLDEALANVNCGRSFPLLTFPSVGNKLFQPSTLQRSAISVFSLQTPHRSQVQRNSTRSTATTQQGKQETKNRKTKVGSCWSHMP